MMFGFGFNMMTLAVLSSGGAGEAPIDPDTLTINDEAVSIAAETVEMS